VPPADEWLQSDGDTSAATYVLDADYCVLELHVWETLRCDFERN
jgi:hypothetical protein